MEQASICAYLLIVFAGLVLLKFTHWFWTIRHLREFTSKYPGPKGFISMWLLTVFTHKFNFLGMVIEVQRYYKCKNLCFWIVNFPVLLTTDPLIISQVCSSPALQNKSIVYSPIKDDFGGGLVFISGDEWRHHRKSFNPAFNNTTLMSMIGKFNAAKDIAISEINEITDGIEHNLEHLFVYLSATTALDVNFNTVLSKVEVNNYLEIAKYYLKRLEWNATWELLNVPFFKHFNKKSKRNMLENKKLLRKILNERMESSIRENAIAPEKSDDAIKKTSKVVVDQSTLLLKSNQISFEDILSEHIVILFAAYETTGFSIFSVLVMLAMHPEVQERVFAEIVDIFPEKNCAVKYEHFQELKYLEMVINETMRVCPAVPYIVRNVTEDTPLKDGLTLPKGLQIGIFIYNLHRDESLWGPDAGRFNPDHFLPENIKNRDPHAFMPFSKGARNCIGWRYAQMLMNIVLPGLIRNFKFSTDYKFEDLKFNNSITMYYEEAPLLKIQRRQ